MVKIKLKIILASYEIPLYIKNVLKNYVNVSKVRDTKKMSQHELYIMVFSCEYAYLYGLCTSSGGFDHHNLPAPIA